MPQTNQPVVINGATIVGLGTQNSLNITAATVVKASKGRICKVNVLTAGSTVGTVNDVSTTGGAAAGNLVFNIPDTVGIYDLNFPCSTGIVVVPGTGQVVSVSFN